jgi:hypothetical protein
LFDGIAQRKARESIDSKGEHMNGDQDVQQRVEQLEKAMAVAETAQAGAQATQAAAMAGMGAAVVAGAAGLVVGMLLGALLSND